LQNETSKRGGRRYLPYVFTEQGDAMLSGLLNSVSCTQVNNAFTNIQKQTQMKNTAITLKFQKFRQQK